MRRKNRISYVYKECKLDLTKVEEESSNEIVENEEFEVELIKLNSDTSDLYRSHSALLKIRDIINICEKMKHIELVKHYRNKVYWNIMKIDIEVLVIESLGKSSTYRRRKWRCGFRYTYVKWCNYSSSAKSFRIPLGIKTEPTHGYMLIPRSSIIKTTLRLANSVGIIDKSYRGEVMAVVDNIGTDNVCLKTGSCYFQIVAFDGNLPTYTLKDELSSTTRGSGGFGSTTKI